MRRTGGIDTVVDRHAEDAFRLLERLIAAKSVTGNEHPAQEVVAEALDELGLEVSWLPLDPSVVRDPAAGIPYASYEGRANVLGRSRGPRPGRSLLLHGHIDTVPAEEPELWASDPFTAMRRDGWMHGRGAGDMKGGFAMGFLALRALKDERPDVLEGPLTFLSAIEEESTGNGTLAAGLEGILADAVLALEPTNLDLLLGGVGILWAEITVYGKSAHAESADRAVNPIEAATRLIGALKAWEEELNTEFDDPLLSGIAKPYNVNIGTLHAGDWASSVPATARLGVRAGFPRGWGPDEAERRIRKVVEEAAGADPLLERPPEVRLHGFRAEGYAIDSDDPLVLAVARAHRDAHGADPERLLLGSTTDARFYLNRFGIPAVCYGPIARDIHGIDEAVELGSVVRGAKTLVRFIPSWIEGERGRP